jgi:hypothetical protein
VRYKIEEKMIGKPQISPHELEINTNGKNIV